MNYAVELTPTAEAELMSAFWYIHERAPLNAARWLKGVYTAIDTLETLPRRCGIAPEAEHLGEELRNLRFKSHRIIFHVDEPRRTVRILYVRHGAQRAIGEPDRTDD